MHSGYWRYKTKHFQGEQQDQHNYQEINNQTEQSPKRQNKIVSDEQTSQDIDIDLTNSKLFKQVQFVQNQKVQKAKISPQQTRNIQKNEYRNNNLQNSHTRSKEFSEELQRENDLIEEELIIRTMRQNNDLDQDKNILQNTHLKYNQKYMNSQRLYLQNQNTNEAIYTEEISKLQTRYLTQLPKIQGNESDSIQQLGVNISLEEFLKKKNQQQNSHGDLNEIMSPVAKQH